MKRWRHAKDTDWLVDRDHFDQLVEASLRRGKSYLILKNSPLQTSPSLTSSFFLPLILVLLFTNPYINLYTTNLPLFQTSPLLQPHTQNPT